MTDANFRVWVTGEEYIDIEADRFEIEEGGVVAFYKDEVPRIDKQTSLGDMTSGDEPFTAFREWNSVKKL